MCTFPLNSHILDPLLLYIVVVWIPAIEHFPAIKQFGFLPFPAIEHPIFHFYSLDPCHQTFKSSVSVKESTCTDQYTTPHPHHSNNTKQHFYPITHQWRHPISIQQSICLDD